MLKPRLDDTPESLAYRVLCRQLRRAHAGGWILRLGDGEGRDEARWHEPWTAALCPGVRFVATDGETTHQWADTHSTPILIEVEIGLRSPLTPEFLKAWGAIQRAYYPDDGEDRLARRLEREEAGLYRPLQFGALDVVREPPQGASLATGTILAVVRRTIKA